jgi:hypothetical protein
VLGQQCAVCLGSDRLPAYLTCAPDGANSAGRTSAAICSAPSTWRRRRRPGASVGRPWRSNAGCFGCGIASAAVPLPAANRSRDDLIAKVRPIGKALFAVGDRHMDAPNTEVRNLAVALCQHHDHLFTFVVEDGVEPTNNAAERALRTAVQWRKISFGTRSKESERAVERLPSVVHTCQMQELNALVYLTAAIAAHRRGQQTTSLLRRAQRG